MEDRKEAMMRKLAARHEQRLLKTVNQPQKKIDLKATEKAFLQTSPSAIDMKTPVQPTNERLQADSEGTTDSPILSFDEAAEKQIVALATWCNTMIGMDSTEEVDLGATKTEACKKIQQMLTKKSSGDEEEHTQQKRFHRLFEKNDSAQIKQKCQKILRDSGVDESIKDILSKKFVAVRNELSVYSDLTVHTSLLRIFLSFHPAWLKAALEAIFDVTINANPRFLISTLSRFLIDRVFTSQKMLKNKKFAQGSGKPIVTPAGKEALHNHFLLVTMKLMFLIETAHLQKVIPNLTRIFTKSSTFKCLDDMCSELTKELLTGSSAPLKKAFIKIGFTPAYKQSFIENYDYQAKGFNDFQDGLILAKLVETVGELKHGELLLKLRDPSGDRIRKVNNVKMVLSKMSELEIGVEDVTAASIVAGKKAEILAVLWTLVGVRVAKESRVRPLRPAEDKENSENATVARKRRSAVHDDVSSEALKICKIYGRELDIEVLDLDSVLDGKLLSKALNVYVPYELPIEEYEGRNLWEKVVTFAENELHIRRGLDQNVALFTKEFFKRMQMVRMYHEKATVIQNTWRAYAFRKNVPKMYAVVQEALRRRDSLTDGRLSISVTNSTFTNATFTIPRTPGSSMSDRQSVDSSFCNSTFTMSSRESVTSGTFRMPKTPTRVTFAVGTKQTIEQVIEEEDETVDDTIVPSTLKKRHVRGVKVFEEEPAEESGSQKEDADVSEPVDHQVIQVTTETVAQEVIEVIQSSEQQIEVPVAMEEESPLEERNEESAPERNENQEVTESQVCENSTPVDEEPSNESQNANESVISSLSVSQQQLLDRDDALRALDRNQQRFADEQQLRVELATDDQRRGALRRLIRETNELKRQQREVFQKRALERIERHTPASAPSTANQEFADSSLLISDDRSGAGHDEAMLIEEEEEMIVETHEVLTVEYDTALEPEVDSVRSVVDPKPAAAVTIQKVVRGFLARRRFQTAIAEMRKRVERYHEALTHEDGQLAAAGNDVEEYTSTIESKLRKSALQGLTNNNLHYVLLGASIIDRITDLVPSLLEKFVVDLEGITLIYDILRVADRGLSYQKILQPLFNILHKSFRTVSKEVMNDTVVPILPKLSVRLAEMMHIYCAQKENCLRIAVVLTTIGRNWPSKEATHLDRAVYFIDKTLKKISDEECEKQLTALKTVCSILV